MAALVATYRHSLAHIPDSVGLASRSYREAGGGSPRLLCRGLQNIGGLQVLLQGAICWLRSCEISCLQILPKLLGVLADLTVLGPSTVIMVTMSVGLHLQKLASEIPAGYCNSPAPPLKHFLAGGPDLVD